MSDEARARLAARQAELIWSLVGLGAAPVGFDVDRVQAAAQALAMKRRRAALRAWPGLAVLETRFAEQFQAYAEIYPLPEVGGPGADGRAFVRYLSVIDAVPDDVLLDALEFDLRMSPRWLPAVKWVRLRKPRRLILGMRLPGSGLFYFRCR
jgi:hypothetical protein